MACTGIWSIHAGKVREPCVELMYWSGAKGVLFLVYDGRAYTAFVTGQAAAIAMHMVMQVFAVLACHFQRQEVSLRLIASSSDDDIGLYVLAIRGNYPVFDNALNMFLMVVDVGQVHYKELCRRRADVQGSSKLTRGKKAFVKDQALRAKGEVRHETLAKVCWSIGLDTVERTSSTKVLLS